MADLRDTRAQFGKITRCRSERSGYDIDNVQTSQRMPKFSHQSLSKGGLAVYLMVFDNTF